MDLSDVKQIYLGEDEVIQITDDQGNIMWKKESPEPVTDLFYIKNESDQEGTLTVTNGGGTLRYSTDAVNWTDYDFTTHPTISVAAGKKVWLKGAKSNPTSNEMQFSMDVNHSIGGNIMSIIDEVNYQTMTSIPQLAFQKLFMNNTQLTDASLLNFGNATTLQLASMSSMFNGCSSLLLIPNLDFLTSIDNNALSSMFAGCTSITTSPDFRNVTSVLTGGLLQTFNGCSSLNTVYAPNITNWSNNTSFNWLRKVAASGTMYCPSKEVADLIPDNSGSGCPTGWVKSYPQPTFPYFYIENTTANAGTISVSGSGRGFSATLSYSTDGTTWTAVNTTSDTIPIAANGKVYLKGTFSPSNDTFSYEYSCSVPYVIGGNLLSTVDETNFETATTVGDYAFMSRFNGDTNLTDASDCNLGVATTMGVLSMVDIFQGCTSLTKGMQLSSITNSGNSFGLQGMYLNCSSLTEAYAPNDTTWGSGTTDNPYDNWLSGVSASGTLYCQSQAIADAIPSNSASGCPSGWTLSSIS